MRLHVPHSTVGDTGDIFLGYRIEEGRFIERQQGRIYLVAVQSGVAEITGLPGRFGVSAFTGA